MMAAVLTKRDAHGAMIEIRIADGRRLYRSNGFDDWIMQKGRTRISFSQTSLTNLIDSNKLLFFQTLEDYLDYEAA